jgi:hypothetical protein
VENRGFEHASCSVKMVGMQGQVGRANYTNRYPGTRNVLGNAEEKRKKSCLQPCVEKMLDYGRRWRWGQEKLPITRKDPVES